MKAKTKKVPAAAETLNNENHRPGKFAPLPKDSIAASADASQTLDQFRSLLIDEIIPSKTNPRTVFHETPLQELAASIRQHGILEPLLVRTGRPEHPNGTLYELIAGERRLKAARLAGVERVPVIVKDLTDEQTFDVQIDENWQRRDLEPMDEARGLKFIMERRGWTLEECSARLSKDVRFLAQRLKLNDLISDAQKALDEGKLPVTHAYLICRYGEADQKQIVKDVYGKDFSDNGYKATSHNLKQVISTQFETRLASAVFNLNDKKLHPAGLTCSDCPQRVGANPTLFDPIDAKDDRCTNRTCFKSKSETHWQNLLVSWTAKGKKRFGDDYQAAAVYSYSKPNGKQFADALPRDEWKESVILSDNGSKTVYCGSSEHALLVSNWETPKEIQICRDRECKDHWKGSQTKQITMGRNFAEDSETLEERFECAVAKTVGNRAVMEAAKTMAPTIEDKAFLAQMVFLAYASEGGATEPIEAYIRSIRFFPEWVDDYDLLAPWFERTFTTEQLNELLFVACWANRVQTNGWSYKSQAEVRRLALEAGIDHRLYDAEARVATATDPKHVKKLQAYLDDVSKGKEAPVPRLFSKKWKPDDSVKKYTDQDFREFEPDPDVAEES